MRYRIQDAEGRGPWRPGFSHRWIDPMKDDSLCPPMMMEFPDWRKRVARHPWAVHIGCCVDGMAGVHRWFTPSELARLQGLGFYLVDATGLTPLIIGRSQIIGGSRFPLAYLPRVEWSVAA